MRSRAGRSKPYDHAEHYGNQGDLFKHAVLAQLVAELDARRSADDEAPFRYFDANAGRPACTLKDQGEWQQGIGPFSASKVWTASDVKKAELAPLAAYRAQIGSSRIQAGSTCPGSSAIVFGTLKQRELPFAMELWETEPNARADLERHFAACSDPERACVRVSGVSGYDGVSEHLKAGRLPSFVLVDPPNCKANARIQRLLGRLLALKVPFLCWTPKGGRSVGKDKRAIKPAPHFRKLVATGEAVALYGRWRANWGRGFLCQLTLPERWADSAERVAQAVCRVMNYPAPVGAWSVERAP